MPPYFPSFIFLFFNHYIVSSLSSKPFSPLGKKKERKSQLLQMLKTLKPVTVLRPSTDTSLQFQCEGIAAQYRNHETKWRAEFDLRMQHTN